MSRPFLVKEIALQAGVSVATVDRVLNRRGGVRQHTLRRVEQALAELEEQSGQVGLKGRKFIIDIVMEAPWRFTDAVRAALEAEMPLLQPAVFRARYHLAEIRPVAETVALLDVIGRRGSNGALLKVPDVPEVADAVARLIARNVPVVTLVTDMPASARTAYVGMDNRAAGATAAYLIGEWLDERPAAVLAALSSSRFRGEEEREIGFRRALRESYPYLDVVEVSEGHGVDATTRGLVREALLRHPEIAAVYSIGGGNRAILAAFADVGRKCQAFVGHDLDAENRVLLGQRQISAVIHHDLKQDMQSACRTIVSAHGLLPRAAISPASNVQVVTPFNLPAD